MRLATLDRLPEWAGDEPFGKRGSCYFITPLIGAILGISADAVPAAIGGFLGLDTAAGTALLGTGSLAAEAGSAITGALGGAVTGGVLGDITGGSKGILPGVLGGVLTGGAIGGFGPGLGETLGIGTTGGDALAGALGGAAGNAITGGNPLTGALTGGVGGAATGLLGGGGSTGSAAAPAASSAAAVAPPAGVATAPVDLTTGVTALSGPSALPGATDTILGTPAGGVLIPSGGAGAGDLGALAAQVAPAATPVSGPATFNPSAIPAIGASNPAASTSIPGVNAPTPSQSTGILGQLTGAFNKNPLGVALAGGGLLYSLLGGSQLQGNIKQLQGEATGLENQGAQLSSYLQSGTLPPGLQEQVNQGINAAQAQVRQTFAQAGLSGSTMEQEALAQVQQNAAIQTAQIGEGLLQTGITEAQISGNLLEGVIGANQKQAQMTGMSIASLAAALSGRPPTIQIGPSLGVA